MNKRICFCSYYKYDFKQQNKNHNTERYDATDTEEHHKYYNDRYHYLNGIFTED